MNTILIDDSHFIVYVHIDSDILQLSVSYTMGSNNYSNDIDLL